MSDPLDLGERRIRTRWAPWTLSGAPDPDYDDEQRRRTHMGLTDPQLAQRFSRWHRRQPGDYDDMVRSLGYLWDCRRDLAANVTGYRCAVCGATRRDAGS
jgi:hypothetical protein